MLLAALILLSIKELSRAFSNNAIAEAFAFELSSGKVLAVISYDGSTYVVRAEVAGVQTCYSPNIILMSSKDFLLMRK